MLRKLADIAEASVHLHTPISRFGTGDPEARAFAVGLHRYLLERFTKPWDAVNAACVSLKYPGLSPTPMAETIRIWTGSK
ncbi:MAG TPA: hypothetical protein VLT88_02850 [Desulfosarcina sp.]|nr:hypothetical protein [Desulfosarcina sp.]